MVGVFNREDHETDSGSVEGRAQHRDDERLTNRAVLLMFTNSRHFLRDFADRIEMVPHHKTDCVLIAYQSPVANVDQERTSLNGVLTRDLMKFTWPRIRILSRVLFINQSSRCDRRVGE